MIVIILVFVFLRWIVEYLPNIVYVQIRILRFPLIAQYSFGGMYCIVCGKLSTIWAGVMESSDVVNKFLDVYVAWLMAGLFSSQFCMSACSSSSHFYYKTLHYRLWSSIAMGKLVWTVKAWDLHNDSFANLLIVFGIWIFVAVGFELSAGWKIVCRFAGKPERLRLFLRYRIITFWLGFHHAFGGISKYSDSTGTEYSRAEIKLDFSFFCCSVSDLIQTGKMLKPLCSFCLNVFTIFKRF